MSGRSWFGGLDDLEDENEKGDIERMYTEGLARTVDPLTSKDYRIYRDDPAAFFKEKLGIAIVSDTQIMIAESVRDYKVTIVPSATGIGKTFILGAIAAWHYACFNPSETYVSNAPPVDNLRRLFWKEMVTLYNNNREDVFMGSSVVDGNFQVSDGPGHWIEGVVVPQSASKDTLIARTSGKHSPNLLFIFDEGDNIPDGIYEGADGCMSGGTARMIICFNPKKKEGYPYELMERGDARIVVASAFDHPNVISGEDLIPGATTRESVVERMNKWTEPVVYNQGERSRDLSKSNKHFEVPPHLVDAVAYNNRGEPYPPIPAGWRKVIEDQFYYKVLGVYPPTSIGRLFHADWVDAAVSRWHQYAAVSKGEWVEPEGVRPIMGLDVAGGGADSHSICLRYGNIVAPFYTWKEQDPDTAAEEAATIYLRVGATRANVDATGVGAAAPYRMEKTGPLALANAMHDIKRRIELGKEDVTALEIQKIKILDSYQKGIVAQKVMVSERSSVETDEGRFFSLRDEAFWSLRVALRKGEIALPPNGRLLKAMKLMQYDNDKWGRIKVIEKTKIKDLIKYSPDELDALMLTFVPEGTWMGSI